MTTNLIGATVRVLGHEGTFVVVTTRPEGVAVIRNAAPGYLYTSTVPIAWLSAVQREETR